MIGDDEVIEEGIRRHLDGLDRLVPAFDTGTLTRRAARRPLLESARVFGALAVVITVFVIAGPAALDRFSGQSRAEATPHVVIPAGLSPRLSPEDVAQEAMKRIHGMEQLTGEVATPARIVSISATTLGGLASKLPGRATADPGLGDTAIVWFVTAEGTFVNNRTPPGAAPIVAVSGYFIVLDGDGSILDLGFPDPTVNR
jgi:hypothetical protein